MAATETAPHATAWSRDGTPIAYWTTGEGPPLVLVHGGPADHTRWPPLLPHLEPHVTVHAMDRRGRGASGDGSAYEVEREYEDVAAVVDAVAAVSDPPVDVYGHSFGASCALGGATLTSNVRKLVLYEPPVRPTAGTYPAGLPDRLEALLAAGEMEALVETVLREELGMSDDDLEAFRVQPSWPARVAVAHTIPRETRAELAGAIDPERAAQVRVPTLLMTGADSPAFLREDVQVLAAALPDARVQVLEGQEHVADILAPRTFAQHLLRFLRDEPTQRSASSMRSHR